jgi:Fe-S-cluster containining protein
LNIENIEQLLDLVAFYEIDVHDKKLLKRLIYPPLIIGNSYYILGLHRDNNGICRFLKDNKCTIYESRPKICKIFPFTFLKDDNRVEIQINKLAEDICEGINNGPIVIIKELKKLWIQIMKEKQEYEKLISVWNQLASNGMLESNPKTFLNFILGNISIKA